MLLEGSCHCGAVRFTVESPHPYPFNVCYCSICRKTAGASGSAINLSARYDTLKVRGEKHIRSYRAEIADSESGDVEQSPAERKFCGTAAAVLWHGPACELVHPHASVIDPACGPARANPPMLGSKPLVQACVEECDQTSTLSG